MPALPFLTGFAGIKIRAGLAAYGAEYPFLSFWVQQLDEAAPVTAVLCRQENNLFLAADSAADVDELREFCLAVGFSSLQGDLGLIEAMGFSGRQYTLLSVFAEHTDSTARVCDADQEPPPLNKVYRILYAQRNPSIEPVAADGWYADLSHRIRHGTAKATQLEQAAAAVASHIVPGFAVISGVAVLPSRRGEGLGVRVVRELLGRLDGRTVFVACEEGLVSFYEKLGFCPCGALGIAKNTENNR